MKKLLLSLGLWLCLSGGAFAQCVAVGGVNSVPQIGVTCPSEPSVTTYVATGVGIAPASSATDVACLTGSASKVVRVQRIRVSGTAGTAVVLPVIIRKNASADSGGTAATSTALPVPYAADSANAAPSATTIAYTANPTVNDTTPGVIAAQNLALTTTAAPTGNQPQSTFEWNAGRIYEQAPTLRGVAQQVCVYLNGVSVSSGLLNISFNWTEAPQ